MKKRGEGVGGRGDTWIASQPASYNTERQKEADRWMDGWMDG